MVTEGGAVSNLRLDDFVKLAFDRKPDAMWAYDLEDEVQESWNDGRHVERLVEILKGANQILGAYSVDQVGSGLWGMTCGEHFSTKRLYEINDGDFVEFCDALAVFHETFVMDRCAKNLDGNDGTAAWSVCFWDDIYIEMFAWDDHSQKFNQAIYNEIYRTFLLDHPVCREHAIFGARLQLEDSARLLTDLREHGKEQLGEERLRDIEVELSDE